MPVGKRCEGGAGRELPVPDAVVEAVPASHGPAKIPREVERQLAEYRFSLDTIEVDDAHRSAHPGREAAEGEGPVAVQIVCIQAGKPRTPRLRRGSAQFIGDLPIIVALVPWKCAQPVIGGRCDAQIGRNPGQRRVARDLQIDLAARHPVVVALPLGSGLAVGQVLRIGRRKLIVPGIGRKIAVGIQLAGRRIDAFRHQIRRMAVLGHRRAPQVGAQILAWLIQDR